MASGIGKKIQQFTAAVLIALLVIAFAVWGVEDVFRPKAKNAVISLGDENISTREFEDAFRRQLNVLARTEGRQMPDKEAYGRGVHREVLQGLLTSKVIEIDADDLGIGVNRRTARNYVSEIEVFKDELTGQFSEDKLNEVLARQNPRISRAEFEADVVKDLRQQQTIPAINAGVIAPVEYAETLYTFLTEQRRAQVLTLTDAAIETPETPTDEDIQAYIDDNPVPFTAPEYRQVTVLRLENYDFTPDIEVTEDEIKAQYDYKIELGELGTPETRSVVQITAPTQAIAQAVADRLTEGEDPTVVATTLSLPEPVIDENVIKDAILVSEAAEAAFEMDEGAIRVVESSLGKWIAVSTTEITAAIEPDYDSLKDEITQDLLNDKAEQALYDVTDIIEDTMIEGGSLEEAAKAAEVPFASIDFIDRSGRTPKGELMNGFTGQEGLAQDEEILKEIFINELGYETDMFQTSTGGWAAIRVDEIIDSKLREFEVVKTIAASRLTAERIESALAELSSALTDRLRDGATLEELQSEIGDGASLEDIVIIRTQPPESLGPAVTVGLLEGNIGDVESGNGPVTKSRQIAILTDIIENKDGLAGQFADVLQQQATSEIISDLNNAYQQAVIAENPLQENQELVRTTLGIDSDG